MANKNKTPAYVDKAIKWLESRSPEGEQLAFINAEEAQMLKDAGGSGEKAVGGIPSYLPGNVGQARQRALARQREQEDREFLDQLRAAAEQAQENQQTENQDPAFTGGADILSGVQALQQFPQPIPPLPTIPEVEVAPLEITPEQTISEEGLALPEQPDISSISVVPETDISPAAPERVPAAVADTGAAAAATQVAPTQVIGDIQEAIPPEELAQAATEELDQRATVEFQLERITSTIRDGEPLPPWAAPAARNVDSIMLQRGLGASSMAASARTQALIEAGLPIASADAQAYGRIQLQNLNNRQSATLQNASTLAAMRTQNLNARLTAAVNNAQNFLTIDTANLTNQQTANTLSYNAFTQGLFSNQAAENAGRQFNATTENQVEQFFTTLDQSVEEANANRLTAIRQFNTGEINSFSQFLENQRLSRAQFNSQQQASIRAANANWYRSVATVDNRNQMLANSFAAQSALQLRAQDYANLWQRHRDDAHFIFESVERGLDREAQLAAIAQQSSITRSNQRASRTDSLFGVIGDIIGGFEFGSS